ncbi:MAG: nucleotidyltransferase family protein [Anaerolineales bacterium]|jgi:NDP-sugar pyrophosphorylase family protein
MDALITAGGVPEPGEPLYEYTQGEPKALLDVAGKPMAQWVLDALDGATTVRRVVIVGLPANGKLSCLKAQAYLPNQGGMLDNIRAGVEKVVELNPSSGHVLVVSSDIPAITSEMVDWLVDTTMQTDHDVYYTVITRQVMEARFPKSKRSYTHLKDVEVCGGDMNMIRTSMITANDEIWTRILAARKNVFKQASLIGFGTLLLLLLRQLKLESGIKRVCERLDITGRVIFSPYAEIGMDIDKPGQLEILRKDLARKVPA